MAGGINTNYSDKIPSQLTTNSPSTSNSNDAAIEAKIYQLGPYLLALSAFSLENRPLNPDKYASYEMQSSNLSTIFRKCLDFLGLGQRFTANAPMSPEAFLRKLQLLELNVQLLRKALSKDTPEFEKIVHLLLKDVANFIKLFAPLSHNERLQLLGAQKEGVSAEKLLHKLEQKFFSIQQSLPLSADATLSGTQIQEHLSSSHVPMKDVPVNDKALQQESVSRESILIRDKQELVQKLEVVHQQVLNKTLPVPLNNIVVMFPLNKEVIGDIKTEQKKDMSQDQDGDPDEGGGGGEERQMQMALVPEGPLLLGNSEQDAIALEAFLISVHPITNLQYARWITEEIKKGTFSILQNGNLINAKEELICKTQSSDPLSQLQLQVKEGVLKIKPLPGTEMHPVVCVTFIGAEAFCRDNGFRLPTKSEWERAAGMDPENPRRKYLFGCTCDAIDPRYANYAEMEYDLREGNLTTPVGFFNGKTSFIRKGKPYQSKNAASPFGCYDMCGNVSSWTDTWYDPKKMLKITKGGHYGSGLDALTVTAHRAMHYQNADGFTGFRVVMSIEKT